MNKFWFISYNIYPNSGDFSSAPELRCKCTCNGWHTHVCMHFDNEQDAQKEYERLDSLFDSEQDARRSAMLI